MKNNLAENMLRFGVKNLSQSDIEKINETVLTEVDRVIDLSTDPRIPKVFASLKAQSKKGIKFPSAIMGQYLIKINNSYDYVNDPPQTVDGVVLAFQAAPFPKVGNLPCLPDYPRNFGGRFTWAYLSNNVPSAGNITYDPTTQFGESSPAAVASIVNEIMNSIELVTLQTIYNANPNKVKYDAAITAFKASPTGKLTMEMLTGTAKAFYDGIQAAVASPAPVKSATPPQTATVKKA